MSQDTNEQGKMQQTSSQWAEIIGQLFDRLTGKGASATYDFDNLVIDIPKALRNGLLTAKLRSLGKLIRLLRRHARGHQYQP
jgi:hypothetical protein